MDNLRTSVRPSKALQRAATKSNHLLMAGEAFQQAGAVGISLWRGPLYQRGKEREREREREREKVRDMRKRETEEEGEREKEQKAHDSWMRGKRRSGEVRTGHVAVSCFRVYEVTLVVFTDLTKGDLPNWRDTRLNLIGVAQSTIHTSVWTELHSVVCVCVRMHQYAMCVCVCVCLRVCLREALRLRVVLL